MPKSCSLERCLIVWQIPQRGGGGFIVKNIGGGAGSIVWGTVWDFGWENIFWGSSTILIWTIVRR